ncbi:3448_t:CDS:2 [Entrophospora sp. SA101]|nr:3448_t:CDS:2 [Entrophospora sp. SA101]
MANTQSKIDLLKEENSKLIAEITELSKENVKIILRSEDALVSDISNNASNSDVRQKFSTRCYTSPICTEPKSLEDNEVNEFLDSVNKENVSNEIRERNREKKLLRESAINQDLTSDNILSKLSNYRVT